MNETNPKDKWYKKMIKNKFEFYSFEKLIETIYEGIKKEEEKKLKKKEVEENLKECKLNISHISHLYLEISRRAAELLVKHEKVRANLEKGYSNLLKLISKTVKLIPQFQEENGKILEPEREKDTQHLWKNRELCNEAMSHYVRQIQNLRDKRHRLYILCVTIIAIVISVIPAIISLI